MIYNHRLDTFIKVADEGSFSRAAEAMYISPTAVIKQISKLEAELNVQLFVRTHRGTILTESGKSLYNDVKYLISYCSDSIKRAKKAMLDTDNTIRIGMSLITPSQFLIDLWPKISEECHGIKFKLVPFENTPESAKEILQNLGQNIDVVAGWYDNDFLRSRACAALELSREPVRCAVPVGHRLACKDKLYMEDLYRENLMLNRLVWNSCLNELCDDLIRHHSGEKIIEFEFYDVSVFNQCENDNAVLLTFDAWKNVHPLLKTLPVEWDYVVPFGLLHSPAPAPTVQRFLEVAKTVLKP